MKCRREAACSRLRAYVLQGREELRGPLLHEALKDLRRDPVEGVEDLRRLEAVEIGQGPEDVESVLAAIEPGLDQPLDESREPRERGAGMSGLELVGGVSRMLHGLQEGRDVRVALVRTRRRGAADDVGEAAGQEARLDHGRRSSRGHLVEDLAELEDVGPRVGPAAAARHQLLGCEIVEGAQDGARPGEDRRVARLALARPQVGHDVAAVVHPQDVGRLEVAMHDARLVQALDPRADLAEGGDGPRRVAPALEELGFAACRPPAA